MIRTIKSIFNNFRQHIVDICSDRKILESYLNCDNERQRRGLFTRKRVWTFLNVVNAVLMCFKKTLRTEIAEYLIGHNIEPTTSVAYIKRRGYISSRLFRDLNNWLVGFCFASGAVTAWRRGKYLCGIDGSRISLPYEKGLYRKYRDRNDKGHNLARAAFVTDLTNRLIVMADIYPNKTEERKAALQLLTSAGFPYPILSTIFVMDRGYPSLFLMNWFDANTAGFVIRARRDTNVLIAEFMDSDETSAKVTLALSPNRKGLGYERPRPLTVRLVKRPPMADDEPDAPKGKTEPVVLVTDLDERDFPDQAIVEAYKMRWHSETEIGTEKNELQVEIFSGVREECIRQDFHSAIILYNLESVIRIPCDRKLAREKRRNRRQIDMNCTWAFVTHLIDILFGSPRVLNGHLTQIVNLFLWLTIPSRPGRASPRHERHIKLKGKYITFTNYKRGL